MYFPQFDWPRVSNPKIEFPITDKRLQDLEHREQLALDQAKIHFHERRDDIACVVIEPIQGEGGDNHFRPQFLQSLKDLAHENDALLVFDEVQSGVGITGEFWAHQALGVEPDILCFGKKTQVCGILAGRRIEEVDNHVFELPSRINSTWGGNLVDMVRFDRILEIIEEDNLVQNAASVGFWAGGTTVTRWKYSKGVRHGTGCLEANSIRSKLRFWNSSKIQQRLARRWMLASSQRQ